MNEEKNIVKYDNRFNKTSLADLDAREQNILFSVCSAFTKEKKENIILPLDAFREMAGLTKAQSGVNEARFKKLLDETIDTSLKLTFAVDTEEEGAGHVTEYFTMFSMFKAYWDRNELRVSLNPRFQHYLYDIPEKVSFTMYELEMILKLRSTYSKTLFRMFRQNHKGRFTMAFSEFKDRMGLTGKKYMVSTILQKVKKAIQEFEKLGIYKNVLVETTQGRGRGHPVETISFSYELADTARSRLEGKVYPEDMPEYVYKIKKTTRLVKNPKTQVVYGVTEILPDMEMERCPKCGKPLVYRTLSSGRYAGCRVKCCQDHVKENGTWRCDYIIWDSAEDESDPKPEKEKTSNSKRSPL